MRLLLDTHAFLWWASDGGSRLSEEARDAIASESNEVLLSTASALEIGIKAARGRLELPDDPDRYIPDRLRMHGFGALSIDLAHALRASVLPVIHRDPWDRLLVAQAQIEQIPIVTSDPIIGRYDVETIW